MLFQNLVKISEFCGNGYIQELVSTFVQLIDIPQVNHLNLLGRKLMEGLEVEISVGDVHDPVGGEIADQRRGVRRELHLQHVHHVE